MFYRTKNASIINLRHVDHIWIKKEEDSTGFVINIFNNPQKYIIDGYESFQEAENEIDEMHKLLTGK